VKLTVKQRQKNNDKVGCFSPYASLSTFCASEEIHVALLHHAACF